MVEKVSWAYVTVHIAVPVDAAKEVRKELQNWFGRKYPNTERSSKGVDSEVGVTYGNFIIVPFNIHKRYNPHHVAMRAEKKLNKLLAGV